jgi:solute carrier family 44 (choline transporter-like protein), member 2/4/5
MLSSYKSVVNQDLAAGPLAERKCTDILCCLIFTCFFIAMLAIGFIGFGNGDPALVLYPYDSSGYQCGRPSTVTSDYKYIYYAGVVNGKTINNFTNYRVCLKSCPSETSTNIDCYENYFVQCESSYFLLNTSGSETKTGPYNTDSIWKRFCAPASGYSFFNNIVDDLYVNGVEDWIADISRCYIAIAIVVAIALAISIVYMYLLRFCAGIVLWASIIAIFTVLIVFGIYIDQIADDNYSDPSKKKTKDALNIAAILIYCFVGIMFIVLIFMIRRIQLAIAIMKSGAIFMKDTPSIIFVPISMFLLSVLFLIYWVFALVYIYSSGTLKTGNTVVARISWDDSTRDSLYFELFGIVWITSMKIALTQFIIACTVSIWYFSKEKPGSRAICLAIFYAIRYHLGTLAFGSLLLTFIKFIKFILWYLKEKVYKENFEGNKCLQLCCSCIECYVNCFERFVKFIDKNAYIQTALTGDSFCAAAKNAFTLILENALRFAALGAIGDIYKIIGKVFITCLSSYLGFLIITHFNPFQDEIQSPIPPTCVFALVSYIIAGLFMSIYEMVCDTIIQAYLVDEQLHITGVQFAPEPLKDFMTTHKDKEHKSHCCGCL